MFFLKLSLLTLLIAAHGLLISAGNSVTCEGSTAVLTCGAGLLKIDRANYGRTDSTTCSAGRPTSQITKTDCYATNTLAIVKSKCESKTTCSVPASNSVFSDPCVNTYKYLSISYTCNTETSVTCEGSSAVLKCGSGVLKIDSANYGRTDHTTCSAGQPTSQITKTDCYASKTLAEVKTRCEGKATCSVPASNSVFSEPCVNTYKYLRINYTCNTETSVTCEGSSAVLKCGSGVLKIDSANYGRTDPTTCSAGRPTSQITKNDCYASKTLAEVKTRCEGKTTCSVPVSNMVFSDPCVNTYKFLIIKYFCAV